MERGSGRLIAHMQGEEGRYTAFSQGDFHKAEALNMRSHAGVNKMMAQGLHSMAAMLTKKTGRQKRVQPRKGSAILA
eukprot:1141280-Pelagomonas_calceolata.AAC.4